MTSLRNFFAILFLFVVVSTYSQHVPPKSISLIENEWSAVTLPSETPLPVVKIYLSFDERSLLIKADVKDNHFKDGDRSWRYGDGFFINFLNPSEEEKDSSDKFYAFGFSLINKKPFSVVVNKDGTYFPKISAPPLPDIKIDSSEMTAHYTIRIPWENLYPFNPLKNSEAGINIVYISQNDDGSRIIQMLKEDNYDTESTNYRKFIPLKFSFSKKNILSIAGEIEKRVINTRKVKINLWVRSSKKLKAKIYFETYSASARAIKSAITKSLLPGINKLSHTITLPKNNGLYRLSAGLNDSIKYEEDVYKYSKNSFEQSLKVIKLLTDSTSSEEIRFCGNIIEYHVNELNKLTNNFNDRDDLSVIKNEFETLTLLIDKFTNEHTILKNCGYLPGAFKSKIDSSLQPFSLVLPENFNIDTTHNLMIVLHGSGVNEVDNIKYAAKNFEGKNFILAAPRGRDLSAWYLGETEKDVVDLTGQLKKIFRIDKTIIYGFSMGGYGVWRFGLLYPHLFDAGIVISGIPFNPRDEKPEYDMNNFLDKEKKLPFFVVHGSDDHSLDISYTDKFVNRLKSLGYNISYERVNGGGHGNFSSTKLVVDWLSKMNLFN